MAFAQWLVNCTVLFSGNSSQFFAKASAQSAAFAKQMGGVNAQTAGVGKAMAGATGKANTLGTAFGGMLRMADKAMIGLGVVSMGVMAEGVRSAAAMQDAIMGIALATGKTSQAIDDMFSGTALKMSLATAQSVSQSMDILRVMAQSGINDPGQLQALAQPIAIYADTQFLTKGTDFNESAINAAKIAHEFGARTAADLTPVLNNLWKISEDQPDSMSNLLTQLKYYAPKYAQAGVDPTEILKLQATMDRLGYGSGKSGTGLLQIYRNLLNPTLKQAAAQKALGISGFIGANGVFDPEGMLNKLHAEYDAAHKAGRGKAFDQALNASFSSNAGLIAGVLSSDAGRKQYANVGQTLGRVKDMWAAQAQAMHTLNHQTVLLTSNFKSLTGFIFKPWMEQFTNGMATLANLVGGWAQWMQAHPATAKIIGGGVMGAAAYAGVRLAQILGGWVRLFERVPGLIPGLSATVGHHIGAGGARRAAGAAGGLGEILGGLFGFNALRGALGTLGGFMSGLAMKIPFVSRAAAWLTPILDAIGLRFFSLRLYTAVFGEWLAKLGARFVPVVGEVLIVIDTLNFLRTHMKDIGKVIGEVAGWLVKNMPSVFGEVGKLGVDLMRGMLMEILAVLNPMNWRQAISDMASGISEGFQDATALQLSKNQKKMLPMGDPSGRLRGQHVVPIRPGLPGFPGWATGSPPTPHRERTRDVVIHQTFNNVKDPKQAGALAQSGVTQALKNAGIIRTTALGSSTGGRAHTAASR